MNYLILGAGFTGERVARRLEARGLPVTRARSRDLPLPDVSFLHRLPPGPWTVLHSVPLLSEGGVLTDPTPLLLAPLAGRVVRAVYLSTTGVYGAGAHEVDATTPIAPRTPRETLRAQAEHHVQAGPWTSCILRPAAIYGPGRGAHVSIREGRWRIGGDGSNYISRIHVEDLAAHAEAALLGDLAGAWPVADEEPATSLDITRFCCELLGIPLPAHVPAAQLEETRRADRRVDGSAVRRRLGLTLQFPTYRVGIPASLEEEQTHG